MGGSLILLLGEREEDAEESILAGLAELSVSSKTNHVTIPSGAVPRGWRSCRLPQVLFRRRGTIVSEDSPLSAHSDPSQSAPVTSVSPRTRTVIGSAASNRHTSPLHRRTTTDLPFYFRCCRRNHAHLALTTASLRSWAQPLAALARSGGHQSRQRRNNSAEKCAALVGEINDWEGRNVPGNFLLYRSRREHKRDGSGGGPPGWQHMMNL